MQVFVESMWKKQKYRELIQIMNFRFMDNEIVVENDLFYYGCMLTEIGELKGAINCFEAIGAIENYSCNMDFQYVCLAYFMTGKEEKADKYFRLWKKSNLDKKEHIDSWFTLLDIDNAMVVVESEKLKFHFEQCITNIERKNFIEKNRKAYQYIISIFKCILPKKIDIFVFKTEIDYLGNRLSYANPALCTIHTKLEHTYGHEIVHVVTHYMYPHMCKTPFIDEGTAVYFDIPGKYFTKNRIKSKKISYINIKDLWNNFRNYDPYISYEIAGEFVGFLIEKYSLDKFLLFIQEQTISHAQKTLGEDFEDSLKEFEIIINSNT